MFLTAYSKKANLKMKKAFARGSNHHLIKASPHEKAGYLIIG